MASKNFWTRDFWSQLLGTRAIKQTLAGIGAAGLGLSALGYSSEASAQGIGPHVGAGVLAGDAAGLDDGYVHFGGFVPLLQPDGKSLVFADGSLLLFDEGSEYLGGNAGLGYRSYCDTTGTILGGYIYYDRRDLDLYEFNQIGVGLESLGTIWDARFNVNVPVGNRQANVSGGGFTFGGSGFVSAGKSFNALTTVDGEVGALLYEKDECQFRAFAGVYGLFDDAIDDTAGVRGRLETRIADQCFVGAFIENDNEFNTTGGFTFEVRFGRGKSRSESSTHNLLARLGDPVQRRKHIAIAEQDTTTVLTDGGEEIEFEFLNNAIGVTSTSSATTLAGAAGTFEDPYQDLSEIQNSDADIIYIFAGVYDGESITVAQEGQRVWASSQSYSITADQGTFVIPASGQVIVRNSPGNAITVAANDVTISGFQIENAGSHGIDIGTQTGVQILNNTVTVAGERGIRGLSGAAGLLSGNTISGVSIYGIELGNFTGNIVDNQLSNAADYGLYSSGTVTGDVTGNTMNQNGVRGMLIFGDLDGNLRNNTANDNVTGTGLYVLGRTTGDITDNTANDNGFHGIFFVGGTGGDFTGNTANGNGERGIVTNNIVSGDFSNNTASSNANSGVVIFNDVNGSVSGNTTNDNTGGGITIAGVSGNVGGSLTGNTALRNTSGGIYVLDGVDGSVESNNASNNTGGIGLTVINNVGGDVINNTTSDNSSQGTRITGNVTGDVTGNTANDNGTNGIQVNGTIGGANSPNTTSGNGGTGFLN